MTRILMTLTLALILTSLLCAGAQAADRRQSTRYGRMGAEISAEFPRFGFPTGSAFKGDRDIGAGLGFGFGIMWGISDNLALDGRITQTNHTGPDDSNWDIDQVLVGGRYTFKTEDAFQPFVGLGFSRVALERDESPTEGATFERVSWYGAYLSAGIDYIWSSSWSGYLRADYSIAGFGHETVGIEEGDLKSGQRGDFGGITLGIAYRIPSW
jgi:opacity protein-like surface antigen